MKKGNSLITIIVVLAILAVGGYVIFNNNSEDSLENENMMQGDEMMMEGNESMENDEMMEDSSMDEMMEDGDSMIEDDSMMEESMEEESMIQGGTYEDYSPDKLKKAESGNVVLFFHATWCPYCRSLESDINANLGNIPDDLTILKVDYDKETALRKKYGITTQHTLVQVDANGELITKWIGSPSLADVASKVI